MRLFWKEFVLQSTISTFLEYKFILLFVLWWTYEFGLNLIFLPCFLKNMFVDIVYGILNSFARVKNSIQYLIYREQIFERETISTAYELISSYS